MERAILDGLIAARHAKRPAVLATDIATGEQTLLDNGAAVEGGALAATSDMIEAAEAALRDDRSRTVEIDGRQVFVQIFNPPLRMVIVGAVHIAQPLAPMAALAGYDVTVIDPRESFATTERFPGVHLTHDWPDEAMDAFAPDRRSAVVTLTHDPKLDDPALERALRSDAFYIGALGSKKTHGLRLERLRAAGFGAPELDRINGPIGLAIGAMSPAEIAVAILAQATAALRQAPSLVARAA